MQSRPYLALCGDLRGIWHGLALGTRGMGWRMSVSNGCKAPFIWFGGKSKAAELIWSRFGWSDVGNYVEPFLGSAAVWLNRPKGYDGWAVLNDLDGNVANAWRAMKSCPLEVAEHACNPVHECDLHARHLWLVNNLPKLAGRLMADPDYCEPKTAGWWIWGINQWIGSGWCAGEGGWVALPDDEGIPTLSRASGGVKRKLPHLGDGGKGVSRQLPHLGHGGKGVSRQLPHLGHGGGKGDRLLWLESWFAALSDSLSKARIACGDWERICSVGTITKNGTCAVLLDPPYSLTGAVYAHDSSSVSADVRAWCEKHGYNPKLRIALCGHSGEGHETLEARGWTVEGWGKGGGYQGADDRERIWFSPHCLKHGGLFI